MPPLLLLLLLLTVSVHADCSSEDWLAYNGMCYQLINYLWTWHDAADAYSILHSGSTLTPAHDLEQTSSLPRADLKPSSSRPRADLEQTSSLPRADHEQTSSRPRVFLAETVAGKQEVLLGLRQPSPHYDWIWQDDSTYVFSSWDEFEPRAGEGEQCAVLNSRNTGKWVSEDGKTYHSRFICQTEG